MAFEPGVGSEAIIGVGGRAEAQVGGDAPAGQQEAGRQRLGQARPGREQPGDDSLYGPQDALDGRVVVRKRTVEVRVRPPEEPLEGDQAKGAPGADGRHGGEAQEHAIAPGTGTESSKKGRKPGEAHRQTEEETEASAASVGVRAVVWWACIWACHEAA